MQVVGSPGTTKPADAVKRASVLVKHAWLSLSVMSTLTVLPTATGAASCSAYRSDTLVPPSPIVPSSTVVWLSGCSVFGSSCVTSTLGESLS